MNRRGFLRALAVAPIAAPAVLKEAARRPYATGGWHPPGPPLPLRMGEAIGGRYVKQHVGSISVKINVDQASLRDAVAQIRGVQMQSDECTCKSCTTDPCTPATCPNGKCRATGECIDRSAGRQSVPLLTGSGAGAFGPRLHSGRIDEQPALAVVTSPPLAPAGDICLAGNSACQFPGCTCGEAVASVPARRVVAFTGLARSGKSTAAMHLVNAHGYQRVRFAGPLKDMMRALGLTEAEIEGDRKEVPCVKLTHGNFNYLISRVDAAFLAIGAHDYALVLCGRSYAFARAAFIGVLTQILARGEGDGGATPRLAMQMVGTEWGRELIGRDMWIRAWRAALDRVPAGVPVVVDDCRFPNEAEAVLAVGGTICKIVRPGAGAGAAGHSSEGYALPATMTIENAGTVDRFLVDVLYCFAADAVANRKGRDD